MLSKVSIQPVIGRRALSRYVIGSLAGISLKTRLSEQGWRWQDRRRIDIVKMRFLIKNLFRKIIKIIFHAPNFCIWKNFLCFFTNWVLMIRYSYWFLIFINCWTTLNIRFLGSGSLESSFQNRFSAVKHIYLEYIRHMNFEHFNKLSHLFIHSNQEIFVD